MSCAGIRTGRTSRSSSSPRRSSRTKTAPASTAASSGSFRSATATRCCVSSVARSASASSHEGCVKILYVEDNDDNVYMLKNRLTRAGFTVFVATEGTQGIAMATSEQPDLILMDGTLPDIDGGEATRRIKAAPATKHIPVIALTANAMTGDREKALAAGCDDFDTKPVDLPRLLGKIKALARENGG